ncbi:ECF transporter S component family protein, partial [Actibacterium pelagium]
MITDHWNPIEKNEFWLCNSEFGKKISCFGLIAALSICGFLGNLINVDLWFGVNFIFGSVFVVLALLLMGPLAAVLVALISHSYTYFLWGHAYALVNLCLEAAFLGFFYGKEWPRRDLIILDLIFWALIGAPFAYLTYTYGLGLPGSTVAVIGLKQGINGLVNVVLAYLILLLLRPLLGKLATVPQSWIGWRLSTLFSMGLSTFILVPSVALMFFSSGWEFDRAMEEASERVSFDAHFFASDMENAVTLRTDQVSLLYFRDAPKFRLAEAEDLPSGVVSICIVDSKGEARFVRDLHAGDNCSEFISSLDIDDLIESIGGSFPHLTMDGRMLRSIALGRRDELLVTTWDFETIFSEVKEEHLLEKGWNVFWGTGVMGVSEVPYFDLPEALAGSHYLDRELDVFVPLEAENVDLNKWRESYKYSVIKPEFSDEISYVVLMPLTEVIAVLHGRITDRFSVLAVAVFIGLVAVSALTLALQRFLDTALGKGMTEIKSLAEDDPFSQRMSNYFIYEARWVWRWITSIVNDLQETTEEQERVANDLTQLIDTANAPI